MLQDNDRIRLQHMLDAAERITAFVDNISKEKFQEDEKLNLATIRLLEILGEAANKISDDLQEEYGDVPWRDERDLDSGHFALSTLLWGGT